MHKFNLQRGWEQEIKCGLQKYSPSSFVSLKMMSLEMGSVVVRSRETSRWCSDGGSSWGWRCKRENKGTRLRGQARGIQVVARLHGENGTWGGAGLRRQDWTGAQGFLSAGQQTLRAPFLHRPARSKPRQMHSPCQALWGSSCHFLLPAAPAARFLPPCHLSPPGWYVNLHTP